MGKHHRIYRTGWRSLAVKSFLVFAIGLLLLASGPAWANGDDSVAACKAEAKQVLRACKTTCKEEFRMDKDACLARDHDCAEVCRDERNECMAAILDELEGCNEPCATAKQAGVAGCKAQFEKGTLARDQCIDAVQLVAFQCRDTCREIVGVGPRTKECRRDNRACLKACPTSDDD
jgi:hypothetical protein